MLPSFFKSCVTAPSSARSSTDINASASAKVAIASSRKLMPSSRSIEPKVNRSTPVARSVPTVDSISPNTVMINAFNTCPLPLKAATAESPSTISAK